MARWKTDRTTQKPFFYFFLSFTLTVDWFWWLQHRGNNNEWGKKRLIHVSYASIFTLLCGHALRLRDSLFAPVVNHYSYCYLIQHFTLPFNTGGIDVKCWRFLQCLRDHITFTICTPWHCIPSPRSEPVPMVKDVSLVNSLALCNDWSISSSSSSSLATKKDG